MTHLTSFLSSLFRINRAFSGVGLVLQRFTQPADRRSDRGHRWMNG